MRLAVTTRVAPLLYWMVARLFFVDGWRPRRWQWLLLVPLEGLGLVILLGLFGRGSVAAALAGLALRGLALVLVADALQVAWRGYRDDLVEARRRVRIALVAAGPLAIGLLLLGPALPLAERPALMLRAEAVLLLFFAIAVAALVLRVEPELLAERRGPPRPSDVDADAGADASDLARIERAMASEPWRDSDLTLDGFAGLAQLPVYRLRRVISQRLGHRNFPAFVNATRLEAVARALADPARARTPILTLALDHGFGSIGPFNRAFRARYGTTPSAYREANGAS